MATILDGRKTSDILSRNLRKAFLKNGQKKKLAIINVGRNPSSLVYISRKIAFGKKIGVEVQVFGFEEKESASKIKKKIDDLNKDKKFGGIIVQLPLPKGFETKDLLNAVSFEKDVDGLTEENKKRILSRENYFLPATARGVMELLLFYKIPIAGKKCAVIGQSDLAGRPIAEFLKIFNKDVRIFNTQNPIKKDSLKDIDIVFSATGSSCLIAGDSIKNGAVVVDVGINFVDEEKDVGQCKVVGDVDFVSAEKKASAITPVPGGVGPMTVFALFENLFDGINKKVGKSAEDLIKGIKEISNARPKIIQ